jgi:hypothetical protein
VDQCLPQDATAFQAVSSYREPDSPSFFNVFDQRAVKGENGWSKIMYTVMLKGQQQQQHG